MSATGHYDPNLLAAAPKLTKQQIQEGYSIALLDDPPRTSPTPAPLTPARMTTDPEAVLVPKEESTRTTPTAPVPFIRTRKGLIIIFFSTLVVIAVVVGAAVGTTVHKKNNKSSGTVGQGGGASPTPSGTPQTPSSSNPGGISQVTTRITATSTRAIGDPAQTSTPPLSAPPPDPVSIAPPSTPTFHTFPFNG